MADTSTADEGARRRQRLTAAWTAAVGIAVLVAAAVVARSWRDELPDPVASHWGANGAPNGFSSLNTVVSLLFVIGAVLVVGFAAIVFWLGQTAWIRRTAVGAAIWSSLFAATLLVGTLAIQRGLGDARDAPSVTRVLVAAIVVPLVVAGIAAAVVPGDPPQPTWTPVAGDAPRVRLVTGDAASWRGSVWSVPLVVIALAVAVVLCAVVVLTRLWPLFIAAALVAVFVALMAWVVVEVDRTGVVIRSPVGWPRLRIPLDEVIRADVSDVRPMRDYGGWGWRVGRGGRVGVALRAGEALVIQRTGGRSLAVTVDDAATAAGTVNALVDRARTA